MKKLILIMIMACSTASLSQKKIDSVKVFAPNNSKVLLKVINPIFIGSQLDSLSIVYNTNTFNVVKYLEDGSVVQCEVTNNPKIKAILREEEY
jgi:hypothetical protein